MVEALLVVSVEILEPPLYVSAFVGGHRRGVLNRSQWIWIVRVGSWSSEQRHPAVEAGDCVCFHRHGNLPTSPTDGEWRLDHHEATGNALLDDRARWLQNK